MTHRNRSRTKAALTALASVGVAALILTGCSGGEEQAQVVEAPPPPPPAPKKPAVESIDDLMAQLAIDERVMLDEANAPSTTEGRKAVLRFMDAMVRGDDRALGGMLTYADKVELDDMVESGQFKDAVENIEMVDVLTGPSPSGQQCVLAVHYIGSTYEPQLWYYTDEGGQDGYTFEAVACPPHMTKELSGPMTGWIALWHEILEYEMALANLTDVEFGAVEEDEDDDSSAGGTTQERGGQTGSGRRRPRNPRPAPGSAPGGRPGSPGGR